MNGALDASIARFCIGNYVSASNVTDITVDAEDAAGFDSIEDRKRENRRGFHLKRQHAGVDCDFNIVLQRGAAKGV